VIQKKNAIALGGIETIRNAEGHVLKLSTTFMNNVTTWVKDNKALYTAKVMDCREFKDCASPMGSLWEALGAAYGKEGIDCLFISCHSDWEGLYLYSKIRKELGEEDRYVTVNRDWSTLKFNPGASIILAGCQAGGRFGKRWPKCIAQTISDSSGATVYAFMSRSSQHKRKDGGFEQVPDYKGVARFDPKTVDKNPGTC
jgi:hypothetical protein